jgi:Lon-like ATP-dependent protease
VKELGEDVLPEPKIQMSTAETSDSATDKVSDAATTATTTTVERHDAPPNEPAAPETAVPRTEETGERAVTTEERAPLKIPESVHIRITPDVLKEYVGPPVYHKDRLYAKAPPPGVSTGLGYLGNGSGAVMPIEATVSFFLRGSKSIKLTTCVRACLARAGFN